MKYYNFILSYSIQLKLIYKKKGSRNECSLWIFERNLLEIHCLFTKMYLKLNKMFSNLL